jgi:hypothetical protein
MNPPFFTKLECYQNSWVGYMKTNMGLHLVNASEKETIVSLADRSTNIMWRSEGLLSPDTILILFNTGR